MMDTKYVLDLWIESTSQSFVDAAAAHLENVAAEKYDDREYRVETLTDDDTGNPVVRARVPYFDQSHAQTAFSWVKTNAADYTNKMESGALRLYRTPLGGVTVQEVREWYENNPGEQPTDDDGEPVVPSNWDPMNHLIDEVTV